MQLAQLLYNCFCLFPLEGGASFNLFSPDWGQKQEIFQILTIKLLSGLGGMLTAVADLPDRRQGVGCVSLSERKHAIDFNARQVINVRTKALQTFRNDLSRLHYAAINYSCCHFVAELSLEISCFIYVCIATKYPKLPTVFALNVNDGCPWTTTLCRHSCRCN